MTYLASCGNRRWTLRGIATICSNAGAVEKVASVEIVDGPFYGVPFVKS